jgi:hypothetical protein
VTERDLRDAIVGHARSLFDRGLSPGTSGEQTAKLVLLLRGLPMRLLSAEELARLRPST